MQGFERLVVAMVLKSVDALSDDGGSTKKEVLPTTNSENKSEAASSKKPAAAKPEAKSKPRGVRKRPTASNVEEAAPETSPAGVEPSAKKVSKKPAAEGFPVRKSYYKAAQRFGFSINGKECFYAPKLNSCH